MSRVRSRSTSRASVRASDGHGEVLLRAGFIFKKEGGGRELRDAMPSRVLSISFNFT